MDLEAGLIAETKREIAADEQRAVAAGYTPSHLARATALLQASKDDDHDCGLWRPPVVCEACALAAWHAANKDWYWNVGEFLGQRSYRVCVSREAYHDSVSSPPRTASKQSPEH